MNEERRKDLAPILFYDGECGLCHGAVRFVLKRDRAGRFRFAPLGSATMEELVPPVIRATLPDSLVLRQPDRTLLVRSSAVIALLKDLGFGWRILSWLLWLLPRPVRDFGYNRVAKVRHRLIRNPPGACPLVPQDLRERFLP